VAVAVTVTAVEVARNDQKPFVDLCCGAGRKRFLWVVPR
jgi:hypothetical protein